MCAEAASRRVARRSPRPHLRPQTRRMQALPGIHAKAEANDEDPEVGAWRMIYPRAYLNNVAQQSMAFYEAFAEAQGIE